MPPSKKAFTRERIEGFASLALERAQAQLRDDGLAFHELSCEYRGVTIKSGSVNPTAEISKRSILVFEWQIRAGGAHEQALVTVICDNASRRGVPFPPDWQTALKCQQLPSLAQSAAEEARAEIGRDVDCQVLGVVRDQGAPSASSNDVTPGAILALEAGAVRMPYILCAQVSGSTWLCHRGSFEDGNLAASDPLNEKDLAG